MSLLIDVWNYLVKSITNMQTLVVFLATVLAFVYYILKVWNVWRVESLLKKLFKSSGELLDNLEKNPKMKSLAREYRSSFDSADGKTTEFADSYFNSGSVLLAMGINRQAMSSAAGVLVGLGVLGTFVGLSYSVSGFKFSAANTSTDETLKSIQVLLSGMGTAFFTSLVGMILSTIYIFFEKKSLGNLSRRLSKISDKLDEKFRISEQDRDRDRHETFLQEMRGELRGLLNATDENGNVVSAGSLLLSLAKNTDLSQAALQNLTEELYERATSKAIKPLLEALIELDKSLENFGDKVQNPGANLAESVVKELKDAMNLMVVELKSSFSSSADAQISELSKNLMAAAKNLEDFQNAAATMQGNLSAQSDSMSLELKTVLETLLQTESSINSSLEKMGSVMDGVETTLGKFQGVQNSANETTLNLNNASGTVLESMGEMRSAMENFLGTVSSHSKVHSATVERLSQTSEKALEISKQVAEAFQKLESELKTTFLSMDHGLKGSSLELQQVLSGLQKSQTEINTSLDKTNNVIENVNGTLEKFGDVQYEAKRATENIANATKEISDSMDNLKNAQNDFVQRDSEHSAAVRDTTNEILQTLTLSKQHSAEIFDRSKMIVDAFQNLKGALEAIFEGYNKGLNGYTETVTENTKRILGEWTEKINEFIGGLNGMIEQLNETVEDLSDRQGNGK